MAGSIRLATRFSRIARRCPRISPPFLHSRARLGCHLGCSSKKRASDTELWHHDEKSFEGGPFCFSRRPVDLPMSWNLPSLTALRILEAVARHRSFTRAALELHITQSAVSPPSPHSGGVLQGASFRPHPAVRHADGCRREVSRRRTRLAREDSGRDHRPAHRPEWWRHPQSRNARQLLAHVG